MPVPRKSKIPKITSKIRLITSPCDLKEALTGKRKKKKQIEEHEDDNISLKSRLMEEKQRAMESQQENYNQPNENFNRHGDKYSSRRDDTERDEFERSINIAGLDPSKNKKFPIQNGGNSKKSTGRGPNVAQFGKDGMPKLVVRDINNPQSRSNNSGSRRSDPNYQNNGFNNSPQYSGKGKSSNPHQYVPGGQSSSDRYPTPHNMTDGNEPKGGQNPGNNGHNSQRSNFSGNQNRPSNRNKSQYDSKEYGNNRPQHSPITPVTNKSDNSQKTQYQNPSRSPGLGQKSPNQVFNQNTTQNTDDDSNFFSFNHNKDPNLETQDNNRTMDRTLETRNTPQSQKANLQSARNNENARKQIQMLGEQLEFTKQLVKSQTDKANRLESQNDMIQLRYFLVSSELLRINKDLEDKSNFPNIFLNIDSIQNSTWREMKTQNAPCNPSKSKMKNF